MGIDTSSYSLEVRLIASAWSHKREHSGKTMKTGQQNHAKRFGIPASPKKTILRWEQELFLTGSIKDKASTGGPLTRRGSCAEVEVSGE